jgi:hypothetical protein
MGVPLEVGGTTEAEIDDVVDRLRGVLGGVRG